MGELISLLDFVNGTGRKGEQVDRGGVLLGEKRGGLFLPPKVQSDQQVLQVEGLFVLSLFQEAHANLKRAILLVLDCVDSWRKNSEVASFEVCFLSHVNLLQLNSYY